MRHSCLDCARKHLAQAIILLIESQMGYPLHAWIAVGHMAEAEAETIEDFNSISNLIRSERILLMDDMRYSIDDDGELKLESFTHKHDLLDIVDVITMTELSSEFESSVSSEDTVRDDDG